MDINRNQFFFLGIVLVLLGVQYRITDSMLLTPQLTKILAERTHHPVADVTDTIDTLAGINVPLPPKTVIPPDWLGWALLSIGAVCVLHSLAMRRPE